MNFVKTTMQIVPRYFLTSVIRGVSTTPCLQRTPRTLVKMKKTQADYQCEDGIPIWLKAGFCDRVLYTSTIVGCFVGVFMVILTLYDNAKPESWKSKPTC